MNNLTAEMRRSLKELDLGLKGELTITSDMEALSDSLFFDLVSGEDSGGAKDDLVLGVGFSTLLALFRLKPLRNPFK